MAGTSEKHTVFGMNGVQVKCLFKNGFTVSLTRSPWDPAEKVTKTI